MNCCEKNQNFEPTENRIWIPERGWKTIYICVNCKRYYVNTQWSDSKAYEAAFNQNEGKWHLTGEIVPHVWTENKE